jgi:peptide/nickel transport system substrate-binding protein
MEIPTGYWSFNYWRGTRRRLLGGAVIGAGVLGMPLLGCSSRPGERTSSTSISSTAQPVSGGTFTTYLLQNPNSLDVSEQQYNSTLPIADAVLSRLLRTKTGSDPAEAVSGELESDLAINLESPDGIVWTAKIRPEAKFQNVAPVNGRPVQAEDVKASIPKLQAADNNSRAYFDMIDPTAIETPSTDTIVFRLKYPFGPFAKTIAGPSYIVPREGVSGDFDLTKTVIGSGPFLFQDYRPDIAVAFARNPAWFESGMPRIDNVMAPIIADASQQRAQFVAGKLDEFNPSATDLDSIKHDVPSSHDILLPDAALWAMWGHLDRPGPYSDARLRQAISKALDRETLGKAILSGSYSNTPVMGAKYGKWTLNANQFQDADQYLKFDLAAAKQLVQVSGAGEQLTKFAYVQNIYGQDAIAQAINPMLNAAGIKTQLVPLDYQKDYTNGGKGVFFGNYPSDMLVLGTLSGPPTPENFLQSTYSADSTRNPPKVADADLTALINKMLAIVDDSQRLNAAYEIQRYLLSKLYVIEVPSPVAHRLVQPRVQSYNYADLYDSGAGTWAKLWIDQSRHQ